MPLSFQLVGRHFEEDLLFDVGWLFQTVTESLPGIRRCCREARQAGSGAAHAPPLSSHAKPIEQYQFRELNMALRSCRAVFMRGGTSKALVFRKRISRTRVATATRYSWRRWDRPIPMAGSTGRRWAVGCHRCRRCTSSPPRGGRTPMSISPSSRSGSTKRRSTTPAPAGTCAVGDRSVCRR